ncbi:hypothetical protein C5167_025657 [Papaver somniferum]|uniref:Bulb-type lectin domain-containing protein n=1 Tax=Papaver somniferum TaxID=3469 RepID=A0A4Y7JRY5_PAPSO|nr:hypothetical protein C5167_025657 [Papaver somniferum]
MDVSGQIKQYAWSDTTKTANLLWSLPEQLCDVYGICGPFGNCNQDTMKCECLPGFVKRTHVPVFAADRITLGESLTGNQTIISRGGNFELGFFKPAVLGDDANLVLRDGSNPSLVIWQGFDYPTDTYLPGGRIGFNKNTKKTWLLTSWRNQEDPAPGIFTLELNLEQGKLL